MTRRQILAASNPPCKIAGIFHKKHALRTVIRTRINSSVFVKHSLLGLTTLLAATLLSSFSFSSAAENDEIKPIQLVFAGDIMLDELPGEDIKLGRDPFTHFSRIFADADFTIGNLECVVATVGEKVEKPFTFRADPRVLKVLKRHFDAVSLANNHTGDFGHAAFLEQLDLLRDTGIPYFGGGRDTGEARKPHVFAHHGIRIALLGYNDFKPRTFEAGPNWPGVAWSVDEQVVADIKAARTIHHADLVIPFMHWGWEEEGANDRQMKLARLMIDNGADVVVGGHPHVTQGAEYYKGKLIVYSLGNFVFNGFKTPETNTGWVLRLTLNKRGLQEWDTIVARLDPRGSPLVDPDVESPWGNASSEKILMRKFQP